MQATRENERTGLLYGIAAYLTWGILPIYWKWLSHITPSEVLAHRIIWTCPFVGIILVLTKRLKPFLKSIRTNKYFLRFFVSSLIIATNWGIFIWAVQNGHVLESSLGYFICPLMNILLGLLIYKEHLSKNKKLAVSITFLAVLYLTLTHGKIPWIALSLSLTFAAYGASKKNSKLNPIEGLFYESLILILPAALYLVLFDKNQAPYFADRTFNDQLLLMGSGTITALPLIWFAASVRRLPMTVIGMLQYIAPTLHFLVAIYYFKEEMNFNKLIAFILIWLALLIFTGDSFRKSTQPKDLHP